MEGRGWAISQVRRGRKDAPIYGYAIRTSRWRYTQWGENGSEGEELYDHENDPEELTNLATNADLDNTIRRLKRQLASAIKQTFPSSGDVPTIRTSTWAPNLTDP